MTKIAGSGTEAGSGSISRRHGSADPDPDLHQSVIYVIYLYYKGMDSDLQCLSIGIYFTFLISLQISIFSFLRNLEN
jgi:hypothetical protein